MPFPSIFSSSTPLSERIDTLRDAESRLLEFAKTRFSPFSPFSPQHHSYGHVEHNGYDEYDSSNHEFELFDTPIEPPSVLSLPSLPKPWSTSCLRSESSSPSSSSSSVASCQVFDEANESSSSKNRDKGMYHLHGVKVTNKSTNEDKSKSSGTNHTNNINGSDASNTSTQSTKSKQSKQPAPLVLLHGYANGSLYFYRNLMQLSHYHFPIIYALDLLGWGLSSRPTFELELLKEDGSTGATESMDSQHNLNADTIQSNNTNELNISNDSTPSTPTMPPKSIRKEVQTAEHFFIESLESWRQHHSLPKLTLAGHSMGGYLSVAYAEKYPQHVERLILLSPVGVPIRSPQDELDRQRRMENLPFYIRGMINTVRWMFDRNITPGGFLRSLPFSKSRQLVDGYVSNRLPAIEKEEERVALSEYLYQNSMLPGSGECALSWILDSGAFARWGLVDRIPELKCGGSIGGGGSGGSGGGSDDAEDEGGGGGGDGGMEIHFVYGMNDWMDYKGGVEVQRLCWEKRREWEERRTKRNGNTDSSGSVDSDDCDDCDDLPPPKVFVHGVRDAGHLLMLENYQEFNAAVIIAGGGEENLPVDFPRPVEVVCKEMAEEVAEKVGKKDRSQGLSRASDVMGENAAERLVMDEFEAQNFFRGARFNRRMEKKEGDSGGASGSDDELSSQSN